MANDLNQCTFTGRLGRDAEVKFLTSGDAVANFTMAVGKKWKDKNSEVKEATTWVRVTFFGVVAEKVVGPYGKKGTQVLVVGEMTQRKYTDKDGAEKEVTEIKGEKFQLLGNGPSEAGAAPASRPAAPAARPAAAAPAPARKPAPVDDGDVPF